ncbi:AT-hook motif nuclear-localized protein 1-like [Cornus florida]|uniref:AT-hook motif nuclear-localized protein 1-like n=1 Tax=Cornus florida TaxID=4283 RepID=UPI00289D8F45|nr:AT-hook motif nuclear-localized protein 1-like [Cornus florida]
MLGMEQKESTVSGSSLGTSETESPPVAASGGVPPVMNMSMERNLGAPIEGVGVGGGNSVDLLGKKKRGRPRKYDSDGNLRLSYVSSPPPGFSLSPSSDFSSKRGCGRPPGSGNWQILASLGEMFAHTAGGDFTPHVVAVNTGEDVTAKILSISQKGPRGICVLSANGAVSNVTIRQPGSSGGILTYEGRFEILSLTGSFAISENGDVRSRTGGLSVSLAGPDGRVIGGGIAGFLIAASPIQMVVGSFMPNGYKAHKRKHQHDPGLASVVPGAVKLGTAVRSPILQAATGGNISLTPIAPIFQLPIQSPGQTDNNIRDRQNLNVPSSDSSDWDGSEPISDQRPTPDINMCVPVEH